FAAAFVIKEEESAILYDRPTNRSAEVIPAHRGDWYSSLIIEVVIGVEDIVAQELIRTSMKSICPRFGNGVNYRSRGEANLRAKIRLLQFKFLHGINGRRVERIHDGRVLLHTDGAHPINQDVGLRIAATIRDKVVGHCVGTER